MQRRRIVGKTYFNTSTVGGLPRTTPYGRDVEGMGQLGTMGFLDTICGSLCGPAGAAAGKLANNLLGIGKSAVPLGTIAGWQASDSAADQAKAKEAIAYNEQVAKENSERAKLIQEFMKDALGGSVTADDIAFGAEAQKHYDALVAKYGPDVKGLTLRQAFEKYPADTQSIINSLGQVFPGLRGKTTEEIWAAIPDNFKDMTLSDLTGFFPNPSWLDPNSTASNGLAVAGGATAIVALGVGALAIFAMNKKKGKR